MLLGTDDLTILRGSKFSGTWVWQNSVTGDNEDFAGLTATVKIKNIHEEFEDEKNVYEIGTATVEPLDEFGEILKGRIDVEISKEDTLKFAIPSTERDSYGTSDYYSILTILLSTGEVALQAKVKVIEGLEGENVEYLIDNRSEAIIINTKLDDILLRQDEYIEARDELIDVVIPTSIITYNDNADTKTQEYNDNHTDKLAIISTAINTIDEKVNSAASSESIATTKASEASTSASSALSSKASAATSESNALSYKNSASTSATTATTKASEASTSATASANSASAAATSESNVSSMKSAVETIQTNIQTTLDAIGAEEDFIGVLA